MEKEIKKKIGISLKLLSDYDFNNWLISHLYDLVRFDFDDRDPGALIYNHCRFI
jgi:hypothetical protein